MENPEALVKKRGTHVIVSIPLRTDRVYAYTGSVTEQVNFRSA